MKIVNVSINVQFIEKKSLIGDQTDCIAIDNRPRETTALQGAFLLSTVAGSADGASLDGGCDEDVTRLTTPDLHSETFDMNDLSSNAYAVDARRMQLYSHVHPTVSQPLFYFIFLCTLCKSSCKLAEMENSLYPSADLAMNTASFSLTMVIC